MVNSIIMLNSISANTVYFVLNVIVIFAPIIHLYNRKRFFHNCFTSSSALRQELLCLLCPCGSER